MQSISYSPVSLKSPSLPITVPCGSSGATFVLQNETVASRSFVHIKSPFRREPVGIASQTHIIELLSQAPPASKPLQLSRSIDEHRTVYKRRCVVSNVEDCLDHFRGKSLLHERDVVFVITSVTGEEAARRFTEGLSTRQNLGEEGLSMFRYLLTLEKPGK